MAIGFFDGMHLGHQKVVNTALSYKNKGYKTCVFSFTINNHDKTNRRSNLSIMSQQDKTDMLSDMGIGYYINPPFDEFKELSPTEFVTDILYKKLNTKAVCCGYDFRYGKNAMGNVDTLKIDCEKLGIDVNIVSAVDIDDHVASSTSIRAALLNGDIDTATKILGRYYSYSLTVVEGKKLGRTLGFPTVNQCFPDEQIKPMNGVYVSISTVDGKKYGSVTSIGKNPTVGGESTVSETHIFDVNQDLYGKQVRVELVKLLRLQYKFDSLGQLTNQVMEDIQNSKEILKY